MSDYNTAIDHAINVVSQHPETVTKLIIAELKQLKKNTDTKELDEVLKGIKPNFILELMLIDEYENVVLAMIRYAEQYRTELSNSRADYKDLNLKVHRLESHIDYLDNELQFIKEEIRVILNKEWSDEAKIDHITSLIP
jgi:hypothetical protein